MLEARQDFAVGVAELDLHLGAPRHDARGVRVDQDASDRPYRPRARDLGEAVVEAAGQTHQRGGGVLAAMHLGGAGVVLLAADGDPVVPAADDPLDDADALAGPFERAALLDMGLEIADIARRIDA